MEMRRQRRVMTTYHAILGGIGEIDANSFVESGVAKDGAVEEKLIALGRDFMFFY
jgi:hypothetical protein